MRSFGALAGVNFVSQLLGFAVLAFVARRTGPGPLGAYSFDLSIATYVGLVSNLGVSYLATREVAQVPRTGPRAACEVLLIQGVLSWAVYVLLAVLAPKITPDRQMAELLPIVALTVPTLAFTLDWLLLALRRSGDVAVWRLGGQVIYVVLVFTVLPRSRTIYWYAVFSVVGLAITMIGIGGSLRTILRAAWQRTTLLRLARRVRRSIPFGYSLVMLQVYTWIALPLLGYLSSAKAVGLYAVASRLPYALVAVANIWLAVFFPHGSQRFVASPDLFLDDVGATLTGTAVVSIGIAVAAPLCARDLIPALFGARFAAAATPFALLSIAASLVLLQATTSNALLASGNERRYARILTVVAVGLTLANFALIPIFGPVGAASAAIAAEAAVLVLTSVQLRRTVGSFRIVWFRVRRGILAAAVMATVTALVRTTHLAGLEVLGATVSFASACFLFGAFDPALLKGQPGRLQVPGESDSVNAVRRGKESR